MLYLPQLPRQILPGHAVHVHIEQVEHENSGAEAGGTGGTLQGVLHGEYAAGEGSIAGDELL